MIKLNNISYQYEQPVFENLNLEIKKNEKVAIVGPSGCGKSTLLKLILQLITPDYGDLQVNNQAKMIGYMPQDNLLLNWYTIEENLMLPLKINNLPLNEPLAEIIKSFGLSTDVLAKYPGELSGGMKSRIALIRAILMSNEILILDEPLSKLDYITHQQILKWLKMQFNRLELTLVLVTHNLEEALELVDRIIVLSDSPAHVIADYKIAEWDKEQLKQIIINNLI